MRLNVERALAFIPSAVALIVGPISCQSSGVTQNIGSSRVHVEGLVTAGGLPAAGTTVALSVPEAGCSDSREASTYTDPASVVTGPNGRYSASLVIRGLAPQAYCVVARANGVRAEKPGVAFTAWETGTSDTTQLDIVSP